MGSLFHYKEIDVAFAVINMKVEVLLRGVITH